MDPAISEKESADCTAITIWALHQDGTMYLLDYINERLTFDKQINTIRTVYSSYEEFSPIIHIEDVAYQKSLIQRLSREFKLPVKAVRPKGDKFSRLQEVSTYFENGLVKVKPAHDEVVLQLINFGVEKHDDLVDSTIYGIQGLISTKSTPRAFSKSNIKL